MSDTHRNSEQYMLRLPDGLRRELKTAAKANGRSMNAEIISRILDDRHSLRDRFAGQAAAALICTTKSFTEESCVTWGRYAEIAYRIADAMLAERSKP